MDKWGKGSMFMVLETWPYLVPTDTSGSAAAAACEHSAY